MITLNYVNEALDFDARTGVFTWKKVRPRHHFNSDKAYLTHQSRDGGNVAGTISSDGYVLIGLNGNKYLANRLAYAVHNNIEISDLPRQIDHKDRNTQNNRPQNLRPATHSENICNTGIAKNNTSGFKGVSFKKQTGRWMAKIKIHGKQIHLGYFDTALEASLVRNKAAEKLHGEFARAS